MSTTANLSDGDEKPKAMTVGDLRRALDGLPDNLPIVVETELTDENDKYDDTFVSGLAGATVETRCGGPGLFLTATTDCESPPWDEDSDE